MLSNALFAVNTACYTLVGSKRGCLHNAHGPPAKYPDQPAMGGCFALPCALSCLFSPINWGKSLQWTRERVVARLNPRWLGSRFTKAEPGGSGCCDFLIINK